MNIVYTKFHVFISTKSKDLSFWKEKLYGVEICLHFNNFQELQSYLTEKYALSKENILSLNDILSKYESKNDREYYDLRFKTNNEIEIVDSYHELGYYISEKKIAHTKNGYHLTQVSTYRLVSWHPILLIYYENKFYAFAEMTYGGMAEVEGNIMLNDTQETRFLNEGILYLHNLIKELIRNEQFWGRFEFSKAVRYNDYMKTLRDIAGNQHSELVNTQDLVDEVNKELQIDVVLKLYKQGTTAQYIGQLSKISTTRIIEILENHKNEVLY